MANSNELKTLQRQKEESRRSMAESSQKIKEAKEELARHERAAKETERKIEALKQREPIISEHALLRYFERVENRDLDTIRAWLLPPDVKERLDSFPSGTFQIGHGYKVVIKDRVVVTVEPVKHELPPKPPRIREEAHG
jgi:hypothetical protein